MSLDNPKEFINTLPTKPGVYQMIDASGGVLYVGKARDLRNRVGSYFRASGLSTRIISMTNQIDHIEITVTHTESEALILESNLIKSIHPKYNILLRDDKGYPYIFLSDEIYPRLSLHRGARKAKGRYFGPYPSASSVKESLGLLQKLFAVRQCDNSYFKNRSRPCLQYQIKRCSGPCTEMVTPEEYREDVKHTTMFLEGRSTRVIEDVIKKMDSASEDLEFETAARYRDQVTALKNIQERQYVSGDGGEADVLAVFAQEGQACVGVTFIRGGRNLGNKYFFPKILKDMTATDSLPDTLASILSAFLGQYYADKPIPPLLLISQDIEDRELLELAFSQQTKHKVSISQPARGNRLRWIKMTQMNTDDALRRRLLDKSNMRQQVEALQQAFKLEAMPERIECFDISHTMGEATVGSCVVFDQDGPLKSEYRRFNIKDITPGDDYAAMEQTLRRRYKRVTEEAGQLPDILLIDGGKGQLTAAENILQELQINQVLLVGVAKGPTRKPGLEQLFLSGKKEATILAPDAAALHLIQRIRDEAHRFAITGHRQQRAKRRTTSVLEEIPGVGGKRRQVLLKHLGGMQEVSRAGIEDLARVPGISKALAKKIYDTFH